MKKKLVASLAAAMVLGVAGTSFAAANPFVDVPAKHWAYASVMTLSQAGIVDGYGDGKFQGDKMISRYEMAQIVAKAMAKSDKADAKLQAEITKLAAEFAEELNVIGVRVTNLEKNASTIKFTGSTRVRWNNTENAVGTQQFKDKFLMNMDAKINENTSVYARFVFSDDAFNQDGAQRLSDLAMTTKGLIPNTDVTLGRYSLNLGPTTYLSGTTGDIDGIMTNTKNGNFGLMAGYAQARNTGTASLVKQSLFIKNIGFAEATYTAGKVKFNADYLKNTGAGKSSDDVGATTSNAVVDAYDITGGGLVYTFDSNVKVIGEYYKNDAKAAKMADGSQATATIARIAYKGVSAAKPGSWGAFVEYNKFEKNSMPFGFSGASVKVNSNDVSLGDNGLKSYVVGADYGLAKNVTFNSYYQFNIKNAVTGVDSVNKSFTRMQVNYLF